MNFERNILLQFLFFTLLQLNFAFLESKDSKSNPHSILRKNVPISVAFRHKDTEEFVKRLEYAAVNSNGENSLDYGLTPLDLNLLPDDLFAEEVADGVDDELTKVDAELGDEPVKNDTAKITDSLLNSGGYEPSPEFNSLIDDLVALTKDDIDRRKMDPLYFTIHPKGYVKHLPQNVTTLPTSVVGLSDNKSNDAIGIGIIEGLLKLKRFGNAESRSSFGAKTLVRSHYFFGPLKISLGFEGNNGLRTINSTLSAWAAHALHEVSGTDNSTTLLEFITDNPMEYEIRLRGSKNPRFRTLSQTAITRLFKRNGRMEVRLLRSFRRAAVKFTKNTIKDTIKSQQANIGRLKAGGNEKS